MAGKGPDRATRPSQVEVDTEAPEFAGHKVHPMVWKAAFIKSLRSLGNVAVAVKAVQAAGVDFSRRAVYYHLEHDPEFRADYEEAMAEARDLLTLAARQRAVNGVEEPVFGLGWVKPPEGSDEGYKWGTVEVGKVRKYSDRLLETLLKGEFPHKYGTRHITITEEQLDAELDRVKAEVLRRRALGAAEVSELPEGRGD